MSFEACSCGTGGKNTGQPNCVPTIDRTAKIIMVQTYANDGTRNSINKSDFTNGTLGNTFIEGKINESDTSKRWYVTPKINAVTDTRAESVTFDVDGIAKIIDQGIRTFTGSFYDKLGSPTFAGVLNSFQCQDMSYYEISVNGDIVGIDGGDELFPIDIESGTFFAGVVRGTKTELNAVSLTFAVNELVRDENLLQIAAGNIETDMLLTRGLIQVEGEALATPTITATTVRLDLGFIYGTFDNAIAFEGLTANDLSYDGGTTPATVFNNTQSASIAVSSVTAVTGSAGQYDVVLAAGALSADEIQVALSKTSYEMTAFTYLIP